MDEFCIEQSCEVVLTYRQPEPEAPADPVVLRYERELPEQMRRRPEPEPETEEDEDPFVPRAPVPKAPPPALWQSAIAPPERAKGKGRWGVRLFVAVTLMVILVGVGTGLWYVRSYGWSLPGGSGGDRCPSGIRPDDERPPYGDDFYYYWDEEDTAPKETTVPRYPTGGSTRLTLQSGYGRAPLTIQEIYAAVNPSAVTVLGQDKESYSVGTGIIFSADGYILTNHHVIDGCSACTVWVDGDYGVVTEHEALLVASDPEIDLAVLKIDAQGLPAAEFGVSDELVVGDPAYAIGNPLGTELRNTLTPGVVSYVNREVDVDGVNMTLIQTSAPLNNGNSGGPLINQYGQDIGVNTIKMMSETNTIEGLGFAIPSSLFVRWVNELIEFGEIQPQPTLGVEIMRIPVELPDGNTGLEVSSVTPGGSGMRAGVQVGDYVIEFNGQRVYSVDQILAIRRDLHVGDNVIIRVFRNGEYLDLSMVMMAGS